MYMVYTYIYRVYYTLYILHLHSIYPIYGIYPIHFVYPIHCIYGI